MAETIATTGIHPETVILQLFDNSVYLGESEDGVTAPAERGPAGNFHIEGEILLAGKDQLRRLFALCEKLIKSFKHCRILMITPLARYSAGPCCDNPQHMPNRDYFCGYMKIGLDEMARELKGLAFALGRQNIRVINPANCTRDTPEELLWGQDKVHPKALFYELLSDSIMLNISIMDNKKREDPQTGPSGNQTRQRQTRSGYSGRSQDRDSLSKRGRR